MQPQTQVKRGLKRAVYDREQINQILDDTYLCHIGGVVDGYPAVQPNLHWRIGDTLYIHGSSKNGLINAILTEGKTCITVSALDGIVFAKSAFHHSVNYRSVMLFGTPILVEDELEKREALDALLEKFKKGRSKETRPPNATEMKATSVIGISLEHVSAKVRATGPEDDPADLDLPFISGVLPIHQVYGEFEPFDPNA